MTTTRRSCIAVLTAMTGLVLLPMASLAQTQTFPARSIRMIVPFSPGGAVDANARLTAQKLGDILGQQVVLENRPGSGGLIGAEAAARSAPDGYTLFFGGSASHGINPNLYKKIPYDPIKDFEPVGFVGFTSYILVVNPKVPAKDLKELIALMKQKPGQLNYASAGNGSTMHLTGELFKSMAGVNMVHVPYPGAAPAITDVMTNRVQMVFGPEQVLPQVRAGKLRAMGTTGPKRSVLAPDLPTIAEAGLPGYESLGWYGILAPAGTPKPIVATLNAALQKVLADPDFQKRAIAAGTEPKGGTPEEFAAYIKAELGKWGKVVRDSGAQVD